LSSSGGIVASTPQRIPITRVCATLVIAHKINEWNS
jgi:hypothetical protein